LALTAAAGLQVRRNGGSIEPKFSDIGSLHYFVRMGLFSHLDTKPPTEPAEHEPAGRFIPLTQVRTGNELNDFVVDMVPLLHAKPNQVAPIKYVLSELIRNVIEHAWSPVGAVVCAQLFPQTNRLAVGVADTGSGVKATMSRAYIVDHARDAIDKALRPGVTGTTSKVGGTAQNAGAGLFFTKAIARASRNYFILYSGDSLYKLTPGSKQKAPTIEADPNKDPHRWGCVPHGKDSHRHGHQRECVQNSSAAI
jgi:anti-sigma regulatory factor (Ser/Thr protein kinase)